MPNTTFQVVIKAELAFEIISFYVKNNFVKRIFFHVKLLSTLSVSKTETIQYVGITY